MELIDIFTDLHCEQKYRYHMAKPNDQGHRPIDALVTTPRNAWLQWQLYKGKDRPLYNFLYCNQIQAGKSFKLPDIAVGDVIMVSLLFSLSLV
jgi:hypothetical protein